MPRRKRRPPPRPWTPDEDRRLSAMIRLGLSCDYWHIEFPDRRFGEIAERRLDLNIPRAREI
jgi:hypothetical protein